MKKVLMIVGSLRQKSFNRQLANEIECILGERAEVTYLEYGDLPYFNQDIEFPAPESVSRIREMIQKADGIWICSPEYNSNISGVLKNLLDWLSRPLVENDWKSGSPVKEKMVTISGAAGKSAAGSVRRSLMSLLEKMSMNVIFQEGTGVALDAEAFKTDQLLLSDERKAVLTQQAEEFLAALSVEKGE